MFKFFKQIFAPENKDIKKKISFSLLALLVFSIGTSIRIPGTQALTADLGFLELLNAMNGGALKQFSIFALGVSPYISASIITGLLQMDIIPYFSELAKEGPQGRAKLNKINRYLGLIMAFVQGIAMGYAFFDGSGAMDYLRVALILTAGTAFLLWLGDQITAKGVGNGISLLIMAGIISSIPTMFIDAFNAMVSFDTTQSIFIGIVTFVLFVLVYLLIVIGVVFIQISERRIPIQYSNQSSNNTNQKKNYMPFKINSAGVMPVIFASAIVSVPQLIAGLINSESLTLFVNKYMTFTSPFGFVVYIVFIFAFAYLYTFLQIKPSEFSKNLHKSGAYIPGIRPGDETTKYIKTTLSKLTFVGALFLIVIAGLPIVFANLSSLPTSVTIGGTGLLIIVGVALEVYNQIESSLVSRNYGKYN